MKSHGDCEDDDGNDYEDSDDDDDVENDDNVNNCFPRFQHSLLNL